MATLQVRTDQDQESISMPNPVGTGGTRADANAASFKKIHNSAAASSPNTLSTCPSWTSVSPSSLALRPTFSVDSSSDDVSKANDKTTVDTSAAVKELKGAASADPGPAAQAGMMKTPSKLMAERKMWAKDTLIKNEYQAYCTSTHGECCNNSGVTSERKRWVEQTLLSTDYKPYSTNARQEISKFQDKSEVTSERKRWIESTLLSPGLDSTRKIYSSQELPEMKEVVSSVSERRKLLFGMAPDTESYKIYSNQELPELQQVTSSVAERRKWLSKTTQVKSTAELEDEVRQEIAAEKVAAALRKIEEEKSAEEESMKAIENAAESTKDMSPVDQAHEEQENESSTPQLATNEAEKPISGNAEQEVGSKNEEKSGDVRSSVEAATPKETLKYSPVKSPSVQEVAAEKENEAQLGAEDSTTAGAKRKQQQACSSDEVMGTPPKKKRKNFIKGFIKRITPKRKK